MAGMLQVLTYLLCFYLVIKGVEVLQIALASTREKRGVVLAIGALTLTACVVGAAVFTQMQDSQAQSISSRMASPSAS